MTENESDNQMRMGFLLTKAGVMTEEQVLAVLERQKASAELFGMIAQEMYGITDKQIWMAYAEQMIGFCVESSLPLQERDTHTLRHIPLRDAWRFQILPLRYEEDGESLVCATTREKFANALAYANNHLGQFFVQYILVDKRELEQEIMQLNEKIKLAKEQKQAREQAAYAG